MTTKPEKQKIRRLYCKPQLEQVQLVAEEAVLRFCKAPGGVVSGPKNTNCRGLGGSMGQCNAHGS